MITEICVRHFKRFREEIFPLTESVVLAGPNNSGKTTLLQAIAVWKLGLAKWRQHRSGSSATKRTGVPITRQDFTALPLREMNLLWEGRKVAGGGQKAGAPRLLEIVIKGRTGRREWECGLEFQYANPEMVYVRPSGSKQLDEAALNAFPPDEAKNLSIVHIPPLSGTERDEPRRDRGYQDVLVGQSRPGEILRNLLLEISESEEHWNELQDQIKNLFKIELGKPQYSEAQPYIVCEYVEENVTRPLDLANAGSGFLQVLLILAFFYARPAAVLLLDEPDAHLHVILQREVYDLLRKIASQRGCQLIIATHSEVLLDATDPPNVLAFLGDHPRPLLHEVERDALREALKRLSTIDLILARDIGSVLYVEGPTDQRILSEWAKILNHPARDFLNRPYVHWLAGRSLREARDHYFALRAAFSRIRAACLLDGDNRDEPDAEVTKSGLRVFRWQRYEIENYLLVPDAIKRFLGEAPLFNELVDEEFRKQVPEGTDLFSDHVSLTRIKASDEFLIPLLENVGRQTAKKDLYLLAAEMRPDEIHPEVIEKLDALAKVLLPPKAESK